jgi:ATP-dependent DNA ligase
VLRWPVEPMRAVATRTLAAVRPDTDLRYEMKWDGFRALAWVTGDGVRLQSRHGRDLTRYFPDLTCTMAAHLPARVVLDGEILIWDDNTGRTSFTRLQHRFTAGRRISAEAAAHPAHFVSFDVLQDARGRELLDQPLQARRRRLQRLLGSAPPQLPLCPHTGDRQLAGTWFDDFAVAGVEGLVVKDAAGRYQPGGGGWVKVRARDTADYVIGGVTGTLAQPTCLLLGRYDERGVLRFAGLTHPLAADQRRHVAALLRGMVFQGDTAGHPWPCPLPPGWSPTLTERQPTGYVPVEPSVVAEVETDTATDGPFGRLRHRCRHLRIRPDLRPADVTPI